MNFSVTALTKLAALVTVTLTFAVVIAGSISVSVSNQNKVIMGVQAHGTSLAGMSREEVRDFFTKLAQNKLHRKAAVLNYKERSFTIDPADIKLHGNVDKAVNEAYSIGRQGSSAENIIMQMYYAMFGKTVTMDASFDEALLKNKLLEIKKAVDTPPVNASAILQADGSLRKTPSVIGLTLDIQPLIEAMTPDLQQMKLTIKLSLQPDEQPPFIMDEDLATMDGILGYYTTSFYPGDRGDNIGLAASKLEGALVKPGATLSFNTIVGKRTRDAGYKNAGVILYGEPAVDVGGGVCQVSSTLYNAILLAGLTPVQRTGHFIPSSYVPAGRDATVADDLIDFVFRNPLPHPVYLTVGNTGNTLTVFVLGTKADLQGQTISLLTEGAHLSPTLYRIWRKNGQITDKEYLHTDSYNPPKP